jgi:RimJ/RimL family protein N-acetyltransferase
MQEAVEAVLQFGFEQAGFKKIYAETHEDNAASIRLLLRNGFKKEGYLYKKEAPTRPSWSFLRILKIFKS